MPQHTPTIHDPLIIDPRAFDYVQALTDIDSPTFGNQYRSAIKAGYSHNYARVIGCHFPKHRIKKTLRDMADPLAQALVENLRKNPGGLTPYQSSQREEKRMKAEANKRLKEVTDVIDQILGPIK